MQKGVDAVAIGVIVFGVIALIALFFIGNNRMPDPLPAVQMPPIEQVRNQLENPQVGGGGMPAAGGMPGAGGGMGLGAPGGMSMGGPPDMGK